jgi:hypothetical protein
MPWTSRTLPRNECSALERIWPMFRAELESRRQREFRVNDFMDWVNDRPELNVTCFRGDRGKKETVAANPGRDVMNAQNALYHLSGSSENYTITDGATNEVVQPLSRVDKMTYMLR